MPSICIFQTVACDHVVAEHVHEFWIEHDYQEYRRLDLREAR